MDQIHVTLTAAPVPAKVTPKTTTDEVEKIRAELRTVRTALQQQKALYEQLFAKMVREGKMEERERPTFPPLPTTQPKLRPNNKPQGRQPRESTSHQFTFQGPTLPNNTTPAAPDTWAAKTKAHLPAKTKQPPARKLAACVRLFQPNTGPSGFTYIYLHRNRRMQRSEARSNFRRLGLEPSRLLDISMPTRKVIGLLVHVQYAPIVREILDRHGLKPIEFDPTDPSHIADPKHATLAADDRQRLAKNLHANRMMRTLQHMRPELSTAVGRFCVDQQWLTLEQFASVVPDRNPAAGFIPADHRRPQPEQPSSDRRKRRALSISSSVSNNSNDAMTTTQ
jgi:hypothetical protein